MGGGLFVCLFVCLFYTNDLGSINESLGLPFSICSYGTFVSMCVWPGGNEIASSFRGLFTGLVLSSLSSTHLVFPLLGLRAREWRVPFLYRISPDPTKTIHVLRLDGSVFPPETGGFAHSRPNDWGCERGLEPSFLPHRVSTSAAGEGLAPRELWEPAGAAAVPPGRPLGSIIATRADPVVTCHNWCGEGQLSGEGIWRGVLWESWGTEGWGSPAAAGAAS